MPEREFDTPVLSEREFQQAKTRYFSRFAAKHYSAFRPHLGSGELLIPTGSDPGNRAGWRNIAEHCLVEAAVADVLAEALGMSSDERSKVVAAAILHDWYKKREKEQVAAARMEGTYSPETFDQIQSRADAELIDDYQIDPSIVALTHSNVPPDVAGPQHLAGKVLWYVDAMLSGTNPVRIADRFTDLERGWDGTTERPERAAFNQEFSDMYQEQYGGRSLYALQRELGERIGAELADRAGFRGDPNDFPLYLKELLSQRIVLGVA